MSGVFRVGRFRKNVPTVDVLNQFEWRNASKINEKVFFYFGIATTKMPSTSDVPRAPIHCEAEGCRRTPPRLSYGWGGFNNRFMCPSCKNKAEEEVAEATAADAAAAAEKAAEEAAEEARRQRPILYMPR